MKKIIIYGSEYGSTKEYADCLGEKTQTEVCEYKAVKDLNGYEEIIYLGGLYAGSVKGLKETAAFIPKSSKLIICTVGFENGKNESTHRQISDIIRSEIGSETFEGAKIFHLSGRINYESLNFKHKIMMSALCEIIKAKPEEEKTEDDRIILETYNTKLDLVDLNSLDQIIEEM